MLIVPCIVSFVRLPFPHLPTLQWDSVGQRYIDAGDEAAVKRSHEEVYYEVSPQVLRATGGADRTGCFVLGRLSFRVVSE